MKLKEVYQPRINIIKDGDQPVDFHGILSRWKNYLLAIECAWHKLYYAKRIAGKWAVIKSA